MSVDYKKAHQCSSVHQKQIEQSDICGCFYCLSVFSPKEIEEWVDEDAEEIGQTAMCPKCGIDSVIGSKPGFPITKEFLAEMKAHWF